MTNDEMKEAIGEICDIRSYCPYCEAENYSPSFGKEYCENCKKAYMVVLE